MPLALVVSKEPSLVKVVVVPMMSVPLARTIDPSLVTDVVVETVALATSV